MSSAYASPPSLTLPLKGGRGRKESGEGKNREIEALWQRYCDARVDWCEERGGCGGAADDRGVCGFARAYVGDAAAVEEEVARSRAQLVRWRVGA